MKATIDKRLWFRASKIRRWMRASTRYGVSEDDPVTRSQVGAQPRSTHSRKKRAGRQHRRA